MKNISAILVSLLIISNSIVYPQGNKTTYYSINTVGLSFYESSVNNGSSFSLSSMHGVYIKNLGEESSSQILEQGLWVGAGLVVDFLKAGTEIALVYEPRIRIGFLDLYAQLGYGFGVDNLKGFAFGSGLGVPIFINEKLSAQIEGGYGGRASKGFFFLRGGIRF